MGPVTYNTAVRDLERIDGPQIVFLGTDNRWFRKLLAPLWGAGYRLLNLGDIRDSMEKERRILLSPGLFFYFDARSMDHRRHLILAYKHRVPIASFLHDSDRRCSPTDPFLRFMRENSVSLVTPTNLQSFTMSAQTASPFTGFDYDFIDSTNRERLASHAPTQLAWNNDDYLDIQWTNAYREPMRKSQYLHEKLQQLLQINEWNQDKICENVANKMNDYLARSSLSVSDQDIVREHLRNLERTSDPVHLVKCYSSATSFYKYVNQCLAKDAIDFFEPDVVDIEADYSTIKAFLQLVAMIMYHPPFQRYRFRGTTYRGMLLTQADLDEYVAGSKILTKSLLSTSIKREIACIFGGVGVEARPTEIATLCIYHINNGRTALHIEDISELVGEQEVLIFPFAVFQVTRVQRLPNGSVEMTLEELINDGADSDFLFANSNV